MSDIVIPNDDAGSFNQFTRSIKKSLESGSSIISGRLPRARKEDAALRGRKFPEVCNSRTKR